jgi:hypothetical protein
VERSTAEVGLRSILVFSTIREKGLNRCLQAGECCDMLLFAADIYQFCSTLNNYIASFQLKFSNHRLIVSP